LNIFLRSSFAISHLATHTAISSILTTKSLIDTLLILRKTSVAIIAVRLFQSLKQ
jgi:hypothetical protein